MSKPAQKAKSEPDLGFMLLIPFQRIVIAIQLSA